MTNSRAHSASFGLPEVDFEHLFELVPFPLEQDTESSIPKPSTSPITFFDKHLDDSLILKKVTVLPSLISTISDALDGHVSAFNSKHESFHSSRLYLSPEHYDCSEPPKNATDVAERYHNGVHAFLQAASLLVVHPEQPDLKSVFWMDDGRPASPDGFNSQKHSLKYDAHRKQDMLERLKSWDSDRKTLLLSMRDNLPELTIWDMYALSGQSVLEDMSGLTTLDIFPWKHCGTSEHRQFTTSAHVESQSDVSTYIWETAPISSSNVVPAVHPAAKVLGVDHLQGAYLNLDVERRDTRQMLQTSYSELEREMFTQIRRFYHIRWWGTSSESAYEAKNIQILYISKLTDVRDCSNPPFGKLMVAINAAILRDAVDRAPLLDPTLIKGKRLHAGKSHKRQRDTTEATVPVRCSRRRLGETPDETALEEMKHELLTRNISLLYLQHGNYHSNSPSFFRRPNSLGRQCSYHYDDCLTLLVGKKLGEGSIEQVYEAQVLVDIPSGKKERIQHEYAICRRLLYGPVHVAAGDMPTAFGFFEDIESNTRALILSYNVQTLAHRSDPPGSGITISPDEKLYCSEYLRVSMQLASLMGTFERGTWSLMEKDILGQNSRVIHRKQMRTEQQRLEELLDGEPIDGFSVTSYKALITNDERSY
ncbi:hypothetical protein IW262DRAFT_1526805 [Armillaria fumosa]|nr:hypothetical protein IW262DRAFT_1526805 [Armillaria fumosa]